jgi:hypothetical protein
MLALSASGELRELRRVPLAGSRADIYRPSARMVCDCDLELYRQLGVADDMIAAGLELTSVNLWARGRKAAHVEFGHLGAVASPYP